LNRSPGSCPGNRNFSAHQAKVGAAIDAAGKGGLGDAVAPTDGPARVITLADDHATGSGVTLSAPPDRAADALDQIMPLLASASSGSAPSGSFP
jgi:hypothetical protein